MKCRSFSRRCQLESRRPKLQRVGKLCRESPTLIANSFATSFLRCSFDGVCSGRIRCRAFVGRGKEGRRAPTKQIWKNCESRRLLLPAMKLTPLRFKIVSTLSLSSLHLTKHHFKAECLSLRNTSPLGMVTNKPLQLMKRNTMERTFKSCLPLCHSRSDLIYTCIALSWELDCLVWPLLSK